MPVHFTLWPSRTTNEGGYAEITWETFLGFVSSPAVAENKNALEGWSPVRFAGNRRARSGAELISSVVLDDDKTGLPFDKVVELWRAFAGVIHTSHSHTPEAPKYRIVLRCSRDMTPDEHAHVWGYVRALSTKGGQLLDEATKDASRLWFVPAHRAGAPYAWHELAGALLDVEAILAASSSSSASTVTAPAPHPHELTAQPPAARRRAMAIALGSSWPVKGRHEAQLALAGALRSEGWSAEDALEFLCLVARTAGNEDRSKREATIQHTWSRDPGTPITGWTRLKALVDPVVVDVVRGGIGKDAEWGERATRRLEQIAATKHENVPRPLVEVMKAGPFAFETGGFDAELPPINYQIDTLIAHGEVVMLVAHGGSLKTWIAFSLVAAVASGRPWLGRFVTHRGRAAIIDFESGRYEVLRRLKMLGVKGADVEDRLLRVSYPSAQMTDPETWLALAEQRLELIVVDSYNAAAPELDENDARSALMLQHAARLAEHVGCTVVFIHHARKGSGGDRREAVRGSTALFAACDRIFEFSEQEKRDGGLVLATMRSVKDGAGRAPMDVRVELSDQGLRYVDEPVKSTGNAQEENREIVLNLLRANSAGVSKSNLVHMMKGRREDKFEILASMQLANLIVEYRSEKKDWFMLKP